MHNQLSPSDHIILWAFTHKLTFRRYQKIISQFKDLKNAWECNNPMYYLQCGLFPKECDEILLAKENIELQKCKKILEKTNTQIVHIEDNNYPQTLKEIPDPPVFLFYKGSLNQLKIKNSIAIVGTRKCTSYGKEVCETVATNLTKSGISIVSGMAAGIDSFAHHESLKNDGYTIAVLGGGFEEIFPARNRALAKQIEKTGLLLSEYPPYETPRTYFFPRRNRIVAGISRGTIVVEAAERSGSLITAKLALEYNREVFAIPGSIFGTQSRGCHNLISSGEAKLISSAEEVLEELNFGLNKEKNQATIPRVKITPENKIQEKILQFLPCSFSEIFQKTQIETQLLNSELTMMEIKGMVIQNGNLWENISA